MGIASGRETLAPSARVTVAVCEFPLLPTVPPVVQDQVPSVYPVSVSSCSVYAVPATRAVSVFDVYVFVVVPVPAPNVSDPAVVVMLKLATVAVPPLSFCTCFTSVRLAASSLLRIVQVRLGPSTRVTVSLRALSPLVPVPSGVEDPVPFEY